MAEDYSPPKVWTWQKPDGTHLFSSMNRPVSGATHDRDLPRGEHPFQLHSLGTPNGQKVTILLEELLAAGHPAEYDAWLVGIIEGEQFGTGFVSLNPNSKIPALLDCSGPKPFRVFESGAILLHLAQKFGAFIPSDPAARAECLSWLMWQMATAPVIGGGFGHFFAIAPTKIQYAIDRFAMETKRIFDVADRRLGEVPFLAGDEYSIADIAVYGWLGYFHRGEAYNGGAEFLDVASYRNIDRWAHEIGGRVAVRRGLAVNRDAPGFTRERHSSEDIDQALSNAANSG